MERGYIQITEEEIGKPIVEVKIVNGTVWMFKHEIARLFDVYLQTVGNNFRSIFKSGVLREDDVTMERKMKNEKGQDIYVTFYNLEALIFLSYRPLRIQPHGQEGNRGNCRVQCRHPPCLHPVPADTQLKSPNTVNQSLMHK